MSNKLTESQLTVLATIKEAKKATKKAANEHAGNHITIKKLVDLGLVAVNEPTRKQPEVTYSTTTEGKAVLRKVDKVAKAAAKILA